MSQSPLADLSVEEQQALADLAREYQSGGVSRRDAMKGLGMLGFGGLVGAGGAKAVQESVEPASAQAAGGSVGTASSPVDVFAESVDAEETVVGSSGSTTPASELNQTIQDAPIGSTITFSGRIDGQVVLDKNVNLIGAGVQVNKDASNPFVTTGFDGAVIDNSAGTGPALKLDGFRSGIVVGNFGVLSGGPGVQTRKGVVNDDPRVFDSLFYNIFALDLATDDFAFDFSNTMKSCLINCQAFRVGSGYRFENEDANWNYGHIYVENPMVDIDKNSASTEQAYRAVSSSGQLDYIGLMKPHAISEGAVTTDWVAHKVSSVNHYVTRDATVESANTTADVTGSTVDFHGLYCGGGIVDDQANVYEIKDFGGASFGSEIVTTHGTPVAYGSEVTGSRSLGVEEQNTAAGTQHIPLLVSVTVSNAGGPVDAALSVHESSGATNVVDEYVNDNSPATHRANLEGIVPPGGYYRVDTYSGGESLHRWVEQPFGSQ